jgi:hypothetical protein
MLTNPLLLSIFVRKKLVFSYFCCLLSSKNLFLCEKNALALTVAANPKQKKMDTHKQS